MNGMLWLGLLLTAVGLVGYVLGIGSPYPGRAFSVTAVMIGISLVATSRARDREAELAEAMARSGRPAEGATDRQSAANGGRE